MSANSYSTGSFSGVFRRIRPGRGMAFGVIILTALVAFEFFNYSTTEYALNDLLGSLSFLGITWATILAIAFCGIDFAGIARLHTPEAGNSQPNETWYLFGAWLLAATMNAMLTWWGVSLAIANHSTLGNEVIDRQTLLRVVPIFVAILVWLIRVLIIGTYSLAGNRLLSQRDYRPSVKNQPSYNNQLPQNSYGRSLGVPANPGSSGASAFRNVQRPPSPSVDNAYARQEPVYTPVQSASPARNPIPTNTNPPVTNPYAQKSSLNRRS
ncbi:MAG: putative rane protein [Chloroflexi bacterium]|nr:putative rane protein [Chloroflexota bacterium]